MEFSLKLHTIRQEGPLYKLRESQLLNSKRIFLSLYINFVLADSADSDDDAAFHLGLHCLPKYPFRGFQSTKLQ